MAERFIEVSLDKRGVSCTAKLLDDRAPLTCAAVWDALPLGGDVYHAKYARNEIYALIPPFAPQEPPLENPTITPIPGDLCYFTFSNTQLATPGYGYEAAAEQQGTEAAHAGRATVIDLALFYERNNLLINGDAGWVPGIVWGQIVEGLDAMAEACQDLWRSGAVGETLNFRRA
ncbi:MULTISPECIES: DUF3830 family protein [Streptomyces]|uniref:DUF3830 domain-containing protein n=1 Tax=Streptomyces qinglanensis TaxID=943816 RepID=A0A1E7K1A1_9ACTN|nr:MULTISPECIES: DUF3830 family protein [Streptomyces]MBE9498830.1 DUF3830 family protein [Streptomyces sp. GKU 257-1]OEU97636.1 hypothetical protein AN217_06890 [Streptomyces qinglanensis]OEV24724.1 hypothetical protein AN220_17685 [Streptomyces nanshensis]